jgi:hypothetical protein
MTDHATVPTDVLVELAVALCPRNGAPAPKRPAEVIDSCEDRGRRAELDGLLERLGNLPSSERDGFVEALDEIQVRSKLWLIEELDAVADLASHRLLVLGAWYGTLALICNLRLAHPPSHMLCVDRDPHVCRIGEQVIGALYSNTGYCCADVMTYDYATMGSDTVMVNTICEHLPDIEGWWLQVPPGQLVVLQTNNYFPCRDHVNCVRSLDEMKDQTPLSEVLFEGVLGLSLFDRFMLIGRR